MKLPRVLDPVEVRVLGSLMEKEQTTPDAYPLSLNSLLSACNQKSNRTPVMRLDLSEVRAAIDRLRAEVLVWPVEGARVQRFRHLVDRKWALEPREKAVMTVLLLRGEQTAGELRARTERMFNFRDSTEVEETLNGMAGAEEALVVHMGKQPGQKEARWMHLVSGRPETPLTSFEVSTAKVPEKGLSERVSELEERVRELETRLAVLEELPD